MKITDDKGLHFYAPESLHLEAIWWLKWVSGEEYYQILYCAISVAQMVMKLLFWVLEGSYCSIANIFVVWATEMAQYKIW